MGEKVEEEGKGRRRRQRRRRVGEHDVGDVHHQTQGKGREETLKAQRSLVCQVTRAFVVVVVVVFLLLTSYARRVSPFQRCHFIYLNSPCQKERKKKVLPPPPPFQCFLIVSCFAKVII